MEDCLKCEESMLEDAMSGLVRLVKGISGIESEVAVGVMRGK
jgi:hypothetical protein